MKKKSQPFILLTVLVVLLGGVAFYNLMGQNKGDDGHGHDHAEEEALAGQSASVSPNARTEMEQKASAVLNKKEGKGLRQTGEKPLPSSGPVVRNPNSITYKPTPNENATSSQWYQDNSGRK